MKGLDHIDRYSRPPKKPWVRIACGFTSLIILCSLIRSVAHHFPTPFSGFDSESAGPLGFITKPWKEIHPANDRPLTALHDEPTEFQWSSIEASAHLQFQPCLGDFECAKLKLPLDHFNGTYPDHTISLALLKLPAKVPITDPRYGGPILINPGGPGGSGILLAQRDAGVMQTIVDSPESPESLRTFEEKNASTAKYFDIIGFDPRGVGETEPHATCMRDNPSVFSWALRSESVGLLDSSDAALGRLWAMDHAMGTFCFNEHETMDGPDIKQYLTTAYVARDMLEIVEEHARYVNKRANDMGGEPVTSMRRSTPREFVPNETKLQYWGFSYGTFLGSTFASMFPSRVGRLVLDGVVESEEYFQGLGKNSLNDAEKVMNAFYTFCASAGPSICPLSHPDPSPSAVSVRVQNILKSLYHNPLPVITSAGPEVVTYSHLKDLLFRSLYSPLVTFPLLASWLPQIETGNGSALAATLRDQHIYTCPLNESDTPPLQPYPTPMFSILCSDADDLTGMNISSFEKHWRRLEGISPTVAASWARMDMGCTTWKIKPKYRFRGPFEGETNHPLLWVSNRWDPVTPLESAFRMQKRFKGSSVLVNEAAGHCSTADLKSCTASWIRAYFQTGEVPRSGLVCDRGDRGVDGGDVYEGEEGRAEVEEDVRVLEMAAVELRKGMSGWNFFGYQPIGMR